MRTGSFLLATGLLAGGALLAAGGCSSSSSATGTTGGAGGSAVVPQDCTGYCDEIMANCAPSSPYAQYTDVAHCMATCATFTSKGMASDTAGNTLGCRIYHAGAPAKADPATHCQHAGPSGAGVCGTECDGFCQIVVDACPTQYATAGACQTTCDTFKSDGTSYSIADTSGNTVNCRVFYATAATVDPSMQCASTELASAVCK
jgi:hypothetical protein